MKAKAPVRRPRLAGFIRERGQSRSLVVTLDGKQYSRAVTTRTKKEALALLPAFVAEVQSGAFDNAKAAKQAREEADTFAEHAAAFVRNYTRADADGAATRRIYARALTVIGGEVGAGLKLHEITEEMLHRALRRLHDGGLSAGTVTTYRAALSAFFHRMVRLGRVAVSPVPRLADLKLRPRATEDDGRHTALPAGRLAGLLAECGADPALRVWASIMAATGARPGEALALRWQDVDLDRGTIRIRASVKRSGEAGRGRLGSTKTPGSVRTVPIGPALVQVLAVERDRQEAVLRMVIGEGVASLGPLLAEQDCVVPADLANDRRAPASPDAMRCRFKTAATRAGLPTAHAHMLRHSAITAMLAGTDTTAGVSIADAARLAGHSNPTMTGRVYAHAVQSNLQRGATLADGLLAPAPAAGVERLPNRVRASSGR